MSKGLLKSGWLRQLAFAVSYSLVFAAIHPLSDAHWNLSAGLRLLCLLLIPYRYWPALVVGEFVPNFLEVYPCLKQFGAPWVAIRSVPAIIYAMPIAWWCRSRLVLFPSKQLVDFRALIICILGASIVWSANSYLAASVVHMASGSFTAVPLMALGYFLGNYLAALTVVPWALMLRHDYRRGQWRYLFQQAIASPLVLDAAALMIPALLFLAALSVKGGEEVQQMVRMAMFVPVAWLTIKHGWRAAALGGTLVIVCIAALLVSRPDPQVLEMEAYIAIAVTCLYPLGARITVQLAKERREKHAELNIQRLAFKTLQLGEQRARKTAQSLESVAGTMHATNGKLLEHMRRLFPQIENQAFYRQALAAQSQVSALAESMHPVAWRERGLPAALKETIGRALGEAGIAYECEINGRGFSRISSTVLSAAYRIACEAVVYVSTQITCTKIRLTLRGGETSDNRWLVLCVEGVTEDSAAANALLRSADRQRIAGKLGASALDIEELEDQLRIFGGHMNIRRTAMRRRLSFMLSDVEQEVRSDSDSAPVRLWVK